MLNFRTVKGGGKIDPRCAHLPRMEFVDLPIVISDEVGLLMISDGQKLFKSKHGLGGGGYVASEADEKILDEFHGQK